MRVWPQVSAQLGSFLVCADDAGELATHYPPMLATGGKFDVAGEFARLARLYFNKLYTTADDIPPPQPPSDQSSSDEEPLRAPMALRSDAPESVGVQSKRKRDIY